ncbi:MAG: type I restriction endonuclease subunit R, partial [Selenomonadaceae bacterium]|nr:type I restriction endonuclease subunit R [Selenomonadaceae bacterium]
NAIDTEEALNSQERISQVVSYILEHFDQKTMRNAYYSLKGQRVNGFNSILAVSSIEACKKYYLELQKQIREKGRELSIATIFSYAANEADSEDGILDDEGFDTEKMEQSSRDFLEMAMADYNQAFHTNYDTSGSGFQDYYKDLSNRVKKREVDLLIVVNMFLTGFDATTLNTLWVDKNLKMHGLLQAFSRTNRILNSVKAFGNIVCFRDLEKATNDAIGLFGDAKAEGIVLLKTFADYFQGFVDEKGKKHKGYLELVQELQERFPLGQQIIGEENKKDFLVLFGSILRIRNILSVFDEFKGQEILSMLDFQDYTGMYHDVYDEMKPPPGSKDSIMDDVVFELELVKQVEVNIDYILMLVAKYHKSNCQDKEILGAINKAINSSPSLRSKKDLIEKFIDNINNAADDVLEEWRGFVRKQRMEELQQLIETERLKPEEAKSFVANSFRDGVLVTTGTGVDKILPPMSRFGGGGAREKKKAGVIQKLKDFFEKYFGLLDDSHGLE